MYTYVYVYFLVCMYVLYTYIYTHIHTYIPDSVHHLVIQSELLSGSESLQAVERGTNASHPEIQSSELAASVDEDVCVLLEPHRLVVSADLHTRE